ncbi:uncharacterized protein MalAC0309_1732 [Microcella alkaliphila]|uniref:Uncharacterized protein n=1 Tax=Microcella alkaliphila TaxID=279828 RepID=A0A0U5B9T9_9MICO|nr:uncharacterized protein MalAC0309_1732 [Microcella alkaliphila]
MAGRRLGRLRILALSHGAKPHTTAQLNSVTSGYPPGVRKAKGTHARNSRDETPPETLDVRTTPQLNIDGIHAALGAEYPVRE